jgi:hypothetical protein
MGLMEMQPAIERFLAAARRPALREPGEEPFALAPGGYALERRGSRLVIQVWDETRNLVRRIVAVKETGPGKLELTVERFARQQGRVLLVDLARAGAGEERRGTRLVFREQFRRSLHRQFPDWRLAELSTEANLEESLSPAYPRALLKKGAGGLAALAAPPEQGAAAGALTFGLIWLDYLRKRERRLTLEGLALFLPEAEARPAVLRLPYLDAGAAQYLPFVYSPEGYEDRLDPADCGNLETKLEPVSTLSPALTPLAAGFFERLSSQPFVEQVPLNGGEVSLRVRGLEFARATASGLRFGLEHRTAAREGSLAEIEELAREIARRRAPGAADRESPVYRLQPERWLESQVRRHLAQIDSSLERQPVYGQVPEVAGGERSVLDLLAVDGSGRLAVLELKASEDIHLPLQALDYWMRVKWHAERGEFSERGYFPGRELRRDPPRLVLIAPALQFHPQTETILRYLSPQVPVERIGLGVEWRQGPAVMFRVEGARRPVYEYGEPSIQSDQSGASEPEPGAGS